MERRGKVEFGGKLWHVSDLARLFGKHPNTIYKRLKNGMSLADALNKPKGKGYVFTFNDAPVKVKQLAKALNLSTTTILRRRRQGWSNEEIVSPSQYSKGVTAWGRTQSVAAWSRELGIYHNTLHCRLKSGLPPEVALRLPVDKAQSRAKK